MFWQVLLNQHDFYLNSDVIISNFVKTKHLQSFYHASN